MKKKGQINLETIFKFRTLALTMVNVFACIW